MTGKPSKSRRMLTLLVDTASRLPASQDCCYDQTGKSDQEVIAKSADCRVEVDGSQGS